MASNIANTVNFGTTGLNVGDYTYSLYALSAPGYLPLNSYTNSYLVSSYTALGALIVPVITPVSYTATARTLPTSATWFAAAYGNGIFVATSNSTAAASSTDGITWTARTLPASITWLSIAYGNGLFVAVGWASGLVATTIYATSPDGITWTQRALPTSKIWTSVCFGNGRFVAISGYGDTGTAASIDGITWTTGTNVSTASWQSVIYGNGLFVCVAQNGASATSADGITWVSRSGLPINGWTITFGNGVFVVTSGGATSNAIAARSTNGIDWTSQTLPATANWYAVTYGNNAFVALGSTGTAAATSPDGVTWTSRTLPSSAQWQSVAAGPNKFVCIPSTAANTASATIDYAVNATTFTLPVVQPITCTTAYIKAS